MKIQYLGHSAFYIEGKKEKILIDPFIDENPLSKKKSEDFTGITHIFVTHGHFDHMGDTIKIAKRTGALIISNQEICEYLKTSKVKTKSVNIGEKYDLEFGGVRVLFADHPSEIVIGENVINGGLACGYIINLNGIKIYHPGDTNITEEMKSLDKENIDVALLPIGGTYTINIEEAIKVTNYINPKVVIPMHYNTFSIIEADPYEFKRSSEKIIVLDVGEIYEF